MCKVTSSGGSLVIDRKPTNQQRARLCATWHDVISDMFVIVMMLRQGSVSMATGMKWKGQSLFWLMRLSFTQQIFIFLFFCSSFDRKKQEVAAGRQWQHLRGREDKMKENYFSIKEKKKRKFSLFHVIRWWRKQRWPLCPKSKKDFLVWPIW